MLIGMTKTEYVTGWNIDLSPTQHMSGTGTTNVRTPHAVLAAQANGDLPVRAACNAWVHEVSDRPFPPTRSLMSMREPCGRCAEQVAGGSRRRR